MGDQKTVEITIRSPRKVGRPQNAHSLFGNRRSSDTDDVWRRRVREEEGKRRRVREGNSACATWGACAARYAAGPAGNSACATWGPCALSLRKSTTGPFPGSPSYDRRGARAENARRGTTHFKRVVHSSYTPKTQNLSPGLGPGQIPRRTKKITHQKHTQRDNPL